RSPSRAMPTGLVREIPATARPLSLPNVSVAEPSAASIASSELATATVSVDDGKYASASAFASDEVSVGNTAGFGVGGGAGGGDVGDVPDDDEHATTKTRATCRTIARSRATRPREVAQNRRGPVGRVSRHHSHARYPCRRAWYPFSATNRRKCRRSRS